MREINRVTDDSIEFTARSLIEDVERIVLILNRGQGDEEFSMTPVASDATYEWRRVVVPVLSLAAERDRFAWFRSLGIGVDSKRTTIAPKP